MSGLKSKDSVSYNAKLHHHKVMEGSKETEIEPREEFFKIYGLENLRYEQNGWERERNFGSWFPIQSLINISKIILQKEFGLLDCVLNCVFSGLFPG